MGSLDGTRSAATQATGSSAPLFSPVTPRLLATAGVRSSPCRRRGGGHRECQEMDLTSLAARPPLIPASNSLAPPGQRSRQHRRTTLTNRYAFPCDRWRRRVCAERSLGGRGLRLTMELARESINSTCRRAGRRRGGRQGATGGDMSAGASGRRLLRRSKHDPLQQYRRWTTGCRPAWPATARSRCRRPGRGAHARSGRRR